jgi:hypothetical protein
MKTSLLAVWNVAGRILSPANRASQSSNLKQFERPTSQLRWETFGPKWATNGNWVRFFFFLAARLLSIVRWILVFVCYYRKRLCVSARLGSDPIFHSDISRSISPTAGLVDYRHASVGTWRFHVVKRHSIAIASESGWRRLRFRSRQSF